MKFIKIKFFLIGIFILGVISVPYFSFAETQINVQPDEVNVELVPNNPQPYEDVTINVTSYATDLNMAVITWKIDGGSPSSSIGKTSYSFKAKGPDISTTIDISIRPADSMTSITKRITVTPSEVELMWQSINGYTPPFYKGKTLPLIGSLIKVVAIPNTNTITSGNGSVSYTWQNNQSTNLDASGYNKNSYTFKNNMFDDKTEISVTASSVSGNYNAQNTVEIPVFNPLVIFYKKSPTEGILYNNALNKETTMTEDEMTVVAEPYFFPINENGNKFNYDWKINNEQITTPSKKTELTIRPASRGGYATLNFTLENISELFQKASNQLKINL